MDDDEPATSLPHTQDQSAEIGNVQNQLNSTNRSLTQAKAEREPLEQTLANQAAQLSALQTQLSSAKASYETETKLLATFRERMGAQTLELQKAREELIRAESDLSAIRVEKAEIEGTFLRDKEDVRELHRKMAETGTEVAGLKLEIEKAQKVAKQQKGLLAIAKKQLSTKEIERAKAQKELEEAQAEVKEATVERELVEAELEKESFPLSQSALELFAPVPQSASMDAALNQPLPMSLPTSPDPSIKSNNPFDRLTRSGSAASSPRSRSPFLPFADAASVPSPSGAPAEPAAVLDPFGFSQAFGEEPATPSAPEHVEEPAATETATPRRTTVNLESAEERVVSPASDFGESDYGTPPTTAANTTQSPVPDRRLSAGSSIEAQFPALDEVPGSFPMTENHTSEQTSLDGPLKENDIEESDSDSDDEESLANVRHKLQASVDNTPVKAAAPNGSSSFDDAFGYSTAGSDSLDVQTPKPPATVPASLGSSFASVDAPSVDAFGAPLPKTSNPFPSVSSAPKVADVNAFDEAMGKISTNNTGSLAPDFSFDSAFEDNFDFPTASTMTPSFPAPPSAVNGTAVATSPFAGKPSGFDSAFGVSATENKSPSTAPKQAPQPFSFEDAFSNNLASPKPTPSANTLIDRKPSASPSAISFDDAFGGDAAQALKFDTAFGSPSKASATTSPNRQGSLGLSPFGAQSPPMSPQGPESPRISSIRSSSPPPRAMSPPARLGSPGPRPSTSSSSKDGHDKAKEPPTRHSRLSVSISCSILGASFSA